MLYIAIITNQKQLKMKKIISLSLAVLFSQFLLASNIDVKLPSDTIPTKTWSFGVHGGAFSNGLAYKSYNSLQLGLNAEYRISNRLGLQSNISYTKSFLNYESWSLGTGQSNGIEVDLSSKIYAGKQRDWYFKLGVFHEIARNNLEWHSGKTNSGGGQIGLGKEFKIQNRNIHIESMIRFGGLHGLNGGLRLGYRF